MPVVEAIITARSRDLGGLVVDRVLPAIGRRAIGPFLFLDHMGPTDVELSVRPHPHIHLATVTYLFEGGILHRDSLGSKQLITPGAINWMVAGKGIAHSERPPGPAGDKLHGLQIWVGLPTSLEDSEPSFTHTPAGAMPVVTRAGATIRVLAGTAFGATSPVVTQSPLFYADLALDAGAEVEVDAAYPERAVYVVEGNVAIGDTDVAARHLAVIARGSDFSVRASAAARVVVFGGEPLDGERHMWWNFVSSSRERIAIAADDWRHRRFPRIPDDDTDLIPAPDGP
jgi:redox-sensitive bicupin YhaK (pirin superfamily)